MRTDKDRIYDELLVVRCQRGDAAATEELIRRSPLTSYLYAPKKYVREWPERLRAPLPGRNRTGG